MPQQTFSTDFDLTEITIESITGIDTNILFQVDELNVYEDIHNTCISADIVVDDTLNQIKNLPITGHEWIRFSFRTPNKTYISLRLRIYKISKRELEKMHRMVYVLHCVDNVEFLNARTRISKAYKQQLISDIATDIQTNFLASSFNLIEPTKYLHHIIPGYWTPFKTINFLAARANSAQYNGSNYVYYQTADGFNFVSIEKLCDISPLQQYVVQPANTSRKPLTDAYSIQEYSFVNNFDTLENATNGMYTNDLLWYDIQNKQFGQNNFSYPNSYTNYKHVELNTVKNGLSYLWTPVSDFDNDVYGSMRFFPIGLPNQLNWVTQWLQPRLSQMQQIQNVRLNITVPGDSTRRAGDLIAITLPSPEANIQNQLQIDSYYTNRYLVTGLRHKINHQQYLTTMSLVKDSVFTAFQ